MNRTDYVRLSLELHLFFDRIMKEHSFFLKTAFMEKDKDCKSYNDKQLYPCNSTVIVLPYDKNPYRQPLRETSSGLLIGDFESTATYKSKETGEEESSKRGIWCCKVIAVGPNCKNVNVDDDVYVNFLIAVPVPFGNKGYYALSEQNIICAIR